VNDVRIVLNQAEVEAEVRQLDKGRAAGDMRPLALLGTGARATFVIDGAPWDIVPVRGELELRHALVRCEEGDTLTVFLVDYAEQLPLDVTCRLRSNTIHRVTVSRRLAHRFGARNVAPGLAQSAVARRALTLADGHFRPVTHTTLTADDLWEAVLGEVLEAFPPKADARSWLAAAAAGTSAVALRHLCDGDAALTAELDAWVGRPDRAGEAGPLLRRVWTSERGVDLLAWLLVLQAARAHGDLQLLHAVRIVIAHNFDPDLARPSVDALLLPALDEVLAQLEAAHAPIVGAACKRAEDHLTAGMSALARHSLWLKPGYRALRDDLASALANAVTSPEELTAVWSLVDRLAKHRAGSSTATALHTFAARLATWLGWRAARRCPRPRAPGPTCSTSPAPTTTRAATSTGAGPTCARTPRPTSRSTSPSAPCSPPRTPCATPTTSASRAVWWLGTSSIGPTRTCSRCTPSRARSSARSSKPSTTAACSWC
jgi:hypothetical protein